MPIVDYELLAGKVEQRVMNNPEISQKNKEILAAFMDAYDAGHARKIIFLNNIVKVLKMTDDFERDMQDQLVMNKIITELQKELAPATIETIKNVVHKFGKKLNHEKKPEGLTGDKWKRKKANQMRNLVEKDMITWQDGLKIIEQTASLQLKAIFLTQLDCGFRPSEFIDLNYGDVSIKEDMVLFEVKRSKTGKPRTVWMYRAVPQFMRWYSLHPTKRNNDPLWLLDNIHFSHRKNGITPKLSRYTYTTLQHRFDLMFKKALIDKPSDFYNLRHSSCALDKIDNIPLDLASERHGHSVEFFTKIYGRLGIEDKIGRVNKSRGKTDANENKQSIENQQCTRCKTINEPTADFCAVCGCPLSVEQASKVYQEKQNLENEIRSKLMEELKACIPALIKESNKRKKS